MKVLKLFHILFCIMWIGGVMALVSIMLGGKPEGTGQIYMAAKDHLVIDRFFLIPGGMGIVFSALVYSIFTKWGFFKHRWVSVKWIITVLLVLIGKVYMGVIIENNMALATNMEMNDESIGTFYSNASHVAIAGIIQLVGFTIVLILSVVKPWPSHGCGSRKQA